MCELVFHSSSLGGVRVISLTGVARKYWQLPKEATMKDVLLAVRADEANHRDVNHKFSEIRWRDPNPFD